MNNNRNKKISNISKMVTIIFIFSFFSILPSNIKALETPIDQVRYLIQNYYIEEVSEDILNTDNIEEMVAKLNDPYSTYFTKEEYNEFVSAINMKIFGIGIHVKMLPEGVLVKSVIKGSPAEEVGIEDGDIIIKAEGASLNGMELDDAIDYIKGQENTKVNLVIKRDDELLDFKVTRKEIKLPTAEGDVIDDHIGYIVIHSFGIDTESYFVDILSELEKSNVDSYIIDLRFNGGGYMSTAQKIAGHFIGNNTALIVKDKSGEREKLNAISQEVIIDKPVIFLINEYSASASEILSAAVKDYNKAYFVGSKSYGKGVAQLIFRLHDGSALKLTTEEFFSPKGNKINKVGINPDLEVYKADDEYIEFIDSLKIARILLQQPKAGIDKSGYIKIVQNINGKQWSFEFNAAGREEENWGAYKAILEKLSPESEMYLGHKNGWKLVDKNTLDDENALVELVYEDYREFKDFEEIPLDKKFTITFSKEVDIKSFKNDDIELIDTNTGKRLEYDLQQIDPKKIRVIPKENLEPVSEYFLILNNTLKGVDGKSLSKGIINTAKTKK